MTEIDELMASLADIAAVVDELLVRNTSILEQFKLIDAQHRTLQGRVTIIEKNWE